VLGCFTLVIGLSSIREWKQIKSIETSSIRDSMVADGVVKVEGAVTPVTDTPLTSPMAATQCAAFTYDIQRRKGGDWTPVDHGSKYQPFLLDDGTATAYVDPAEDSLSLTMEKIETTDSEQLPDYIDTKSSLAGRRQYKEGCLPTGEKATVVGTTQSPTGDSSSDVEFGPDSNSFLISNQDAQQTANRMLKKGILLSPVGLVFAVIGIGIFSSELGMF
jgi:hypothetical protein